MKKLVTVISGIILTIGLFTAPLTTKAQSADQLDAQQITSVIEYANEEQLSQIIDLLLAVVAQLQAQLEEAPQQGITSADQEYTDMFRGEQFKLRTKYTGVNTWRYQITGSLPNSCWGHSVEHSVVEFNNDAKIYLWAHAPDEGEGCEMQQPKKVNVKGELSADADHVFSFYASKARPPDTLDQ